MLNLFSQPKILLDENIIDWIFNCYAWALEQFDRDVFLNESTLVIPDNKHFPGKETSAEGMASLIFDQVKNYAGMTHWPTQLYNLAESNGQVPQSQPVVISGALRGRKAIEQSNQSPSAQSIVFQSAMPQSSMPISSMPQPDPNIVFTYHPQQLKSPEGIIAHFAHGLSNHLVSSATTPPPGGADYIPMAGELAGIFMGFGIMFANSAVVPRAGGCGGCGGGQSPVRQVFLSEEEATYALAVFCVLKNIEAKSASKHLKKHLRGFFKSAVKDCRKRIGQYSSLQLQTGL
ncbi:hypothetical protein [Aliikangiella coralliicola]|uniref:Uncharacterized protein n=1 Tax=Aliikangiella coralliicola TaxID=2592383 RepID=A0A545UDR3_9GAMM|nr:hypothetical protein [Aliikangiella coralliicola]TQV87598.1 hypothetical protein FLL46_12060 [Aliikangiella coralliicola]